MVNKKYISGEDVVGMDGSVLYRTEPLVDVGEDVYIKPDGNLYGLERPEDE